MAAEREKTDKVKTNNQVKHIPKDAQVIMSILKELNITDYEPRVINQLLEFTYREKFIVVKQKNMNLDKLEQATVVIVTGYVTGILDDAKIYANHAKKKVIDLDDVKLATNMVLDKSFTTPPPRDVLLDIARIKNNIPLPLIKPHCGLRLPPDRYCLSSCNYKLRAATQPKKLMKGSIEPRNQIKTQIKGAAVKRQTITTVPKTQTVTIPKPVFKFSTGAKQVPVKTKIQTSVVMPGEMGSESTKMETEDAIIKRKREEDDFEIVGE